MLNYSLSVSYKVEAVDASGRVAAELPFRKNLITKQGLNLLATYSFARCISKLYCGTGNLVTRRDSGATTFSVSGSTVTASAGFFVADDVDRVLKLNSGEEVLITAYASPTSVTIHAPASFAPGPGTVWYVDLTALVTPHSSTEQLMTGAGTQVSTYETPVPGLISRVRHKRTFLTPAFGANATITELGWGPRGTAFVFGLSAIPPFAVLQDQQLRVTVVLDVDFGPVTPTAVGNVGTNCDTTGEAQVVDVSGNAFQFVHPTNNAEDGYARLEPCASNQTNCFFHTQPFTFAPPTNNPPAVAGRSQEFPVNAEGFTPGPIGNTKYWVGTRNPGILVGNFTAVSTAFSNDSVPVFTHRFNNPVAIAAEQKVTPRFAVSWNRTLTN